MAGLQRSAVSFRRQGSSGLVWDDRFLSGELNKQDQQNPEIKELHTGTTLKSINTIDRSRSSTSARSYRTGKVTPAIEPPSPKLSGCGFCGFFRKTGKKTQTRSKTGKHRSR